MIIRFWDAALPRRIGLAPAVWTSVLLTSVLLTGCGSAPKLAQVEGTVTLDGRPLANKSLLFTPIDGTEGNGAGGMSNAEGKFTLNAMIPGATQDYPGIRPGRYRVTVFEATLAVDAPIVEEGDEPAVAIAPDMGGGKPEFPAIYSTDQSPLVLEVPAAGGELNIVLKSNPGT